VICTGIPPRPKAHTPWIVATIRWTGRNWRPYAADMSWRGKHGRPQLAGTYVLYYPPTTGHPYLVVMFLADGTPQATPFGSEEEVEAFIEQSAPERNER
jgi:hypothetical protein